MANDGASSAYATNVATLAFNHITPGITEIVRKKNGLYYYILGKQERGAAKFTGPNFERQKIVSGVKTEVSMLGTVPTISTVTSGANERAAATMASGINHIGAEFTLCHFAHNEAIEESQWDKVQGGDRKHMEDFVTNMSDAMMLGFEQTLGTAINAAYAPAIDRVGGWVYAVSDGANTGGYDESSYNTYGTLTKSTNTDYQSYMKRSTGTLTLPKIAAAKIGIVENGGDPRIGVCNGTVWGIVYNLVEGNAIITNSPEFMEFGGNKFAYQGVTYIHDKYVGKDIGASNDQLGLLDPSSFIWVMNEKGYKIEVIPPKDARYLQASGHLHISAWCSLICRAPSWNGKMVGITG